MASNYTDLQQVVSDIADRVAAITEMASSPHEVQLYVELHDKLVSSVQIVEKVSLQAVVPSHVIDGVLVQAEQAQQLVDMDADLGALTLGIDRLVASISALPGQSTTGGGGPI